MRDWALGRSDEASGNRNSMSIPAEIRDRRYILLTSFRKSGIGVSTPVWFAERNGKLYVVTEKASGKSKRIRNNPNVRVAPCTIRGKVTGPEFAGRARIVPDAQESVAARQSIRKKYWLARLSFRPHKNEYLEIEITE
ncbi:MAG TPA: PPOX class F420-dependent oxidoreductase [Terriglobales bacterium]|nr:PPOX class F420-dependent oxidoreductase [Terriglobales bacterium]